MKKILFLSLLFCTQLFVQAQTEKLNMRNLFKQMPDSIMPYLTQNNRLDMMDFMDAKMKAGVNNLLGGESEMTFLSDDSLCIKLSNAMTIELKLEIEDNEQVIIMKKTIQTEKRQKEILIGRYSSSWRPISDFSVESTLLKRDEDILLKHHL